MELPTKPKHEIWTRAQRRTLLGLCVMVLIFLLIKNRLNPIDVSDPPPTSAARAAEIADRLDPNTADAAALSAIPNLGEGRARAIVDYREKFLREHPDRPAFRIPADLMNVKGIGPGIEKDLEPFMRLGSLT